MQKHQREAHNQNAANKYMNNYLNDKPLSKPWCDNWREAAKAFFDGEDMTNFNYGSKLGYKLRALKQVTKVQA